MNLLYSTLDRVRDTQAPVTHTSTFRSTGSITPEDFVRAGDYLVYKFPSWQWADAEPAGKQFLVTRGVPCHRRLDDNFTGDAAQEETMVGDGEDFRSGGGSAGDDEDGWLRTGGLAESQEARARDVRTVDESGNIGEREPDDEDEIPDIEDEEDDEEAIIRDPKGDAAAPLRTYTLYITYTPYYRTPRIYLSGYQADGSPLPPHLMMEDIVGDYKDKTVTLEDFPFFSNNIKMASIRREKQKRSLGGGGGAGLEGLVDDVARLDVKEKAKEEAKGKGEDEWEVVQDEIDAGEEIAIRVDQYLVVFLKFISSVTPTIEHDFTMGI